MHYKLILLSILFFPTAIILANDTDTLRGVDYEFSSSCSSHSGSNSLSNQFLFTIYKGDFITDKQKQKAYTSLKTSNRLGSYNLIAIEYAQIENSFLRIKNSGFSIGLEYESIFESAFTKDAFELVFFGNRSFENKDVNLRNSSFKNMDFTTFRFGFRKKSTNSKHLIDLGLGLVNAFKYSSLQFNNASIHFSEDFEVMSSEGSYDLQLADTAKLNQYSHKGTGISLNLLYKYQKSETQFFQLKIRNAGFLWMNKKSFNFKTPISVNPTILEIPNILNMTGFFEKTTVEDSAIKLVYGDAKAWSYRMALPLEIQMEYHHEWQKKWTSAFKFVHRFYSCWQPYIYGDIYYQATKQFGVGPVVSYGGYTAMNIGFTAGYKLWEHSSIVFGTEYISNMLFYSKSHSGIGGFITFTYKY